MKKIWKNLCAVSMALACGTGLVACGDDEKKVSRDLDGDGQISSWEYLFENNSSEGTQNSSAIVGDIVHINSASALKEINNNTEGRKIYVLDADIDLGGEEVAINLGNSELYGNNHVIENFKLGLANTDNLSKDNQFDEKVVRCLFYGGTGVYDTRVFMGVQTLNINTPTEDIYYSISPCFNVPKINNVQVKGRIDIKSFRVDGRRSAHVDASLLYSGMATQITGSGEDATIETNDNTVNIESSNVDGKIVVDSVKNSLLGLNIGAIASKVTKDSTIYQSFAQVEIEAGISEFATNIGGIAGCNEGFVSTCTNTGSIKLNNNENNYADRESVGGIVGLNSSLAEVKNCTTNATITLENTGEEIVNNEKVYLGGIAGLNWGGVLELCQSDAKVTVIKTTNSTVGGFVGHNEKGVVSYGICRGSITVKEVKNITLAQVAGSSISGYFEKIVTTTALDVDNSTITSNSVNVGMLTTFKDIAESPYFSRILVDGKTSVFTRSQDNSVVKHNLGLRYQYKVLVGQEEDVDVYETILPSVFENVFVASTCAFEKYSLVNVDNNNIKSNDGITPQYVNSIGVITPTTRWMIDYLDFKGYLNHNEVSLGEQLVFSDLRFTIEDKNSRMQSYFGYSKYNGELAYYDNYFDKSYVHTESAFGSCENDSVDELFSFVYGLISSNNGKNKENYVIRINQSFLGSDMEEVEDSIEGMDYRTYMFKSKLENVFTCLNATPVVTRLDANGNDLALDESGTLDIKYLLFTFSDDTNNYTMKIDISNLEGEYSEDSVFQTDYILYLTFTIGAKIA